MGPVPDHVSAAGLEAWLSALLRDAVDAFDDLRGELLLEWFDEGGPEEGTPPGRTLRARLGGSTPG
ncbi:hypothetical protein ACIRD3_11575 [Kitasatospora sp. NPDC093550]|uniref:hypothetical protein n=1 Tax=Kitasatospora sp. NPDC093550 TaxID=3364089 RepID=UPI0038099A95